MARIRLDQAMVEKGLCESREKAKRLILAHAVCINNQHARKASDWVVPEDRITITAPERFVSRGGHKLEAALAHFQMNPTGWTAIDLGASTGGFTDCLLQHGVSLIYAVDVGKGQLAWTLRRDPRVVVMEGINARHLTRRHFPAQFQCVDLVVADCSFISLRLVLAPVIDLLKPSGRILALVKPQFEAGKAAADAGAGVIRDARIHQRVLDEMRVWVDAQPDLDWIEAMPSPVLGPAGNREFVALIHKHG